MSIDKVFVSVFSFVGILLTYWFFLMKKDNIISVENQIEIVIDGGYVPSAISIPRDKTTRISFFRKDPSSCLEEVVISEFKIRKFIPLHQKTTIEITPKKTGEFPFSCGMNMFHGKIIVK